MSRLGKKPVKIEDKVEVRVEGNLVYVKGPNGELTLPFLSDKVGITVADGYVNLSQLQEGIEANALWGTYASIIGNMITGVTKGFEKKLIIEGVGYKADARGDKLVLNIGFSHPVELEIPKGIKVVTEKENITISGIDKQVVGEFAAVVRSNKKPEPYKGKGIRYANEIIRRKEGKKAV